MQVTEDGFSDRLRMALKAVNLSPAAFGARLGVDKSVVSRWLSGKSRPGSHNLARICAEIAHLAPGFSALAFDSDAPSFRRALGIGSPAAGDPAPPEGFLPIPYGLVEDARKEIERRGEQYFGHYDIYYWSFTRPGQIARMALMLRPSQGLIEARYGAVGFEFRGWALLLLDRLYLQLAERRFEAMLFIVTNAGQQPRARLVSGILLGPSDQLLVPTASPVVFLRNREITGATAADDDAFETLLTRDPFPDRSTIPAHVVAALAEPCHMQSAALPDCALMRMPQVAVPGD